MPLNKNPSKLTLAMETRTPVAKAPVYPEIKTPESGSNAKAETKESAARSVAIQVIDAALPGTKRLHTVYQAVTSPEGISKFTARIKPATRETAVGTAAAALRIAARDLPWMPAGSAKLMDAAADIITDLGYADPAIVQGAFLAAGSYARYSNDMEAVNQIQAMIKGKMPTVVGTRMDVLKEKRELLFKGDTVPADTIVLMHAVALTPEFNDAVKAPDLTSSKTFPLAKMIKDSIRGNPTALLIE